MPKQTTEQLRAFEDSDGEIYLGYNAREIANELNTHCGRRTELGSAGYIEPNELTMLDEGAILENRETGESVDVDATIARYEAELCGIPRTDQRNRGIVDCIWTYYC